ncbi:MAG: 4-oxalocrotonate tautomerase family protein [Reyranellaceae bacterium]
MPMVTVHTVKGIMDNQQKRTLLDRITDVMVEVEGQGNADFRKSVWVRIEEQEPAHWSLGGLVPTAQQVAGVYGAIGPDGARIARAK